MLNIHENLFIQNCGHSLNKESVTTFEDLIVIIQFSFGDKK